jgi:hypothetical protein
VNATAFRQWRSWLRGGGFEPPTFGLCDLTHLSMRVGPYLHLRGSSLSSLYAFPQFLVAWFAIALLPARCRFRRLGRMTFRCIAVPEAQFAKLRGDFHSNPLVFGSLTAARQQIMLSLNLYMRVDCVKAVLTRRTARRDYPVNAIPTSRTRPGLWDIIPFRFGTPYWTAIGQSTCRSVFGTNWPIDETSIGNDDPNEPYTSLAVRQMVGHSSTRAIHTLSARIN